MTNPANENPNPYVGPRSFRVGERIYGRKREVNQLLNLIVAERIVLLHSPSGAGKTSLIQAALIPRLAKRNFQVLPVVRVNLDVSDALAEGFECNRYVFSALLSLEEDVPEEKKVPPEWLAKMSLPDYLEQRYRPEGSLDLEVLIFDQFEEILTLDPTDQEDKEEFFKQVGEALEAPNRWALFAIRDDYVASLDPYLLWIPNRLSTNFRLDLLGIKAARRAIQAPAQESGVEFEDAAAEKLVDDLRRVRVQQPDGTVARQLGVYVEPVQLQVVCFRIWGDARPDPKRITAEDLVELGQVDQSLVDRSLADYYALQVISTAAATGTRERAIREWFDRRLITEQGVRGTVLMGSEASGGLDNNAIRLLVDAHLVRAEKRAGATWYELSHDRLLEPVRESNMAWYSENLSLLQRQADLWHEEGRKKGLLLVGETLDEAQQWAESNEEVLTQVDEDFLKASLGMRQREDQVRALEQERLEAAEKLAEEKSRSATRAKRWTIAIGIIGLLFVVLAVYALNLYNSNLGTSRFIEDIEACEGADFASCLEAANSAASEEKYLLLVVNACEEGLREVVQRNDPNLLTAVEQACDRVVEMSKDPSSLPQLNELCDSMWYMVGLENMTKKVCDQAIKLAPDVQNLSQVSSTCAIGKNAGFTGDGIDLVCNQAGALVIDSEDISSLFEICTNPFFTTGFDENEIHSICSRYFTVAIESGSPNVLRNLCFDARAIGQSEEDARTACIKAVDLSVEQDDPNTAKELCIFAEGVDQDVVQQACEGYRDIATRIVDSTDDAYVLRDMCSNGSIAGFPEDLIKNACDRGIELVVDSDDPYLLSDMCYSGHVTESEDGLEAVCNLAVESAIINEEVELVGNLCWNIQQEYILIKDSQQACDGFRDLSRKIIDSSNDVYVLSGICFTGLDTGIQGEAIQKACERGVQLAFGTDDSWLIKDYCYNGFEAGLGNDEIDTACNLAAELAIRDEDFELGRSLCWSTGLGRLSESNFQRVCEVGTIQILPGEQISSIVDPGIFDLWSFQGLGGQTVTITLNAIPDNINLNLIIHTPGGEMLTETHTGGGNLTALIDQLQLAESGAYIIGVFNPDSISGEYNLKFMLVEAGP